MSGYNKTILNDKIVEYLGFKKDSEEYVLVENGVFFYYNNGIVSVDLNTGSHEPKELPHVKTLGNFKLLYFCLTGVDIAFEEYKMAIEIVNIEIAEICKDL
jgi:hypothetical protein